MFFRVGDQFARRTHNAVDQVAGKTWTVFPQACLDGIAYPADFLLIRRYLIEIGVAEHFHQAFEIEFVRGPFDRWLGGPLHVPRSASQPPFDPHIAVIRGDLDEVDVHRLRIDLDPQRYRPLAPPNRRTGSRGDLPHVRRVRPTAQQFDDLLFHQVGLCLVTGGEVVEPQAGSVGERRSGEVVLGGIQVGRADSPFPPEESESASARCAFSSLDLADVFLSQTSSVCHIGPLQAMGIPQCPQPQSLLSGRVGGPVEIEPFLGVELSSSAPGHIGLDTQRVAQPEEDDHSGDSITCFDRAKVDGADPGGRCQLFDRHAAVVTECSEPAAALFGSVRSRVEADTHTGEEPVGGRIDGFAFEAQRPTQRQEIDQPEVALRSLDRSEMLGVDPRGLCQLFA
ncbi:hypothetical protein [Nocardia cyriacigeorgica]|uniref:hypothetical protein n=1 Tax=Nocardia cyriacigeorgica TaxID=135487 RepID=UPI0024544617|nr:hypothetical protein [Nocardia cyriacigeorgica]